MTYQAPAADMLFTLRHAAGFAKAQAEGLYDLGDDLVEAILAEAGRFATEVVAPIDRDGDRYGILEKGVLVPETVIFEGIQVGRFEVTRAQYAEFDSEAW